MSTLKQFLSDLWQNGKVEVAHDIAEFTPEDQGASLAILQQFYDEDCLNLPNVPPSFSAEAALWAAQYLYHSTQFILLRHLDEAAMRKQLLPWTGEQTAASIYSVDLSLRHLPALFSFAKGLAPGDPLLLELKKTASIWPFSGFALAEASPEAENQVLSHPALAIAYVDRIIAKRLKIKAQQEHIRPWINAALGNYADTLWPDWAKQ